MGSPTATPSAPRTSPSSSSSSSSCSSSSPLASTATAARRRLLPPAATASNAATPTNLVRISPPLRDSPPTSHTPVRPNPAKRARVACVRSESCRLFDQRRAHWIPHHWLPLMLLLFFPPPRVRPSASGYALRLSLKFSDCQSPFLLTHVRQSPFCSLSLNYGVRLALRNSHRTRIIGVKTDVCDTVA